MVHEVDSSFPDPNGFTHVLGTCITLYLKDFCTVAKLEVGYRGSHSKEVCRPRRMEPSGHCQI